MKRLVLLFGALALASAFHPRAQAQATTTQAIQNPLQVRRNGELVKNAQEVYGTLEDCDGNVTFEFAMDFAAPVPVWEAWLGVGSTNCETVSSRMVSGTAVANPVCKLLGSDTDATARPRITVKAVDMFSQEWGATECDEVSRQLYTVYLLPLNQETALGSNTASQVSPVGGYSTRTATFTLFTNPPNPPTNVKGRTGEARVGVTFDVIAGAQAKTRYRAYFDWGKGGPGECGTGVLEGRATDGDPDGDEEDVDGGADMDAGMDTDAEADSDAEADGGVADAAADSAVAADTGVNDAAASSEDGVRPPPSGTRYVEAVTVTSGEAFLGNLESRGVAIGDKVAVSVVTVDPANNESNLTTPICVERTETASFMDNCNEDPACRDGFTTCSLSSGQRAGSLLGLGSLIALAGALVLRRRRHV